MFNFRSLAAMVGEDETPGNVEGKEAAPELKITSASRVSSDLDHRNEASGLKTAEAAVSVSSARSISP